MGTESEMNSQILIYQDTDGIIKINVRLEDETVWLTQEQMTALFGKAKSTISEHIKNIFAEGELDEKVVVRKFRITTQHGAIAGKTQEVEVNGYNLDVIISVGYRVKSPQGTQFRIWATQKLKEYIVKGFRLFDKVRFDNKEYFIFARRNSGYFDIRDLEGNKVNKGSINFNKLQLMSVRKSILFERRMAIPPLA